MPADSWDMTVSDIIEAATNESHVSNVNDAEFIGPLQSFPRVADEGAAGLVSPFRSDVCAREWEGRMALTDRLSKAASLDEALAVIIDHFAADAGTIHMMENDGLLHLKAATPGLPPELLKAVATIPVGKGMAGLAVERKAPVDACNIQTDSSGDVRPGARNSGLAGSIVVPMFRADDVVGALGIANRRERTFGIEEQNELLGAGRILAGLPG
jgi:L-methionine (R)-S-oxide reductase